MLDRRRIVPLILTLIIAAAATPAAITAQQRDSIVRDGITIRVVTPPPPPADTPLVHTLRAHHALLLELTRKSQRISPETLWVYSSMDGKAWPYAGQPLDTAFDALFEPFYPTLAFPHAEAIVFVTKRFVVDPQHVGYLLRVPGMYESSAIDLWVFDAGRQRFALPVRLAEAYGDEGCGYDLESLLIRSATDGRLTLIVLQNTGCSDIETGKVLSDVDSLWTRPWVGGEFAPPRVSTDSAAHRVFNRLRAAPR